MPVPPDVLALVDRSIQERAFAAYKGALDRKAATDAELAATRKQLADAKSAQADLAMRSARGETVTQKHTTEASKAIRDADAHVQALERALEAMNIVIRETHDALAAADGEMHKPVLERGIDMRIAAAAKIDAARAALVEAEAEFNQAAEITQFAVGMGAALPRHLWGASSTSHPSERLPRYPGNALPRSEAAERALWGRNG